MAKTIVVQCPEGMTLRLTADKYSYGDVIKLNNPGEQQDKAVIIDRSSIVHVTPNKWVHYRINTYSGEITYELIKELDEYPVYGALEAPEEKKEEIMKPSKPKKRKAPKRSKKTKSNSGDKQ